MIDIIIFTVGVLLGLVIGKQYSSYSKPKNKNVYTAKRYVEYHGTALALINNIYNWFENHPEFKLIDLKDKSVQCGSYYMVKITYEAPNGKQLAFPMHTFKSGSVDNIVIIESEVNKNANI